MHIRYITRGLIDGSLSTLGIVIGAAIAGDPKVVMAAGLGGGIANAISNLLGALTAERAAVMKEFSSYEKSMVGSDVELKNTKIFDKEKKRIWKSGLIDGAATFVGAMIPIVPFVILPFTSAIWAAIAATLVALFLLGAYLGRMSRENIMLGGLKMVLFGGATAIAASLIEFAFR